MLLVWVLARQEQISVNGYNIWENNSKEQDLETEGIKQKRGKVNAKICNHEKC